MENPESYFWELRNHFFWLKHLNSFICIRDPGSGMEKIQIWDQGSRMEKIWIQYTGSRMGNIRIRDPGCGINIPDQQNWKFCHQICKDLKNRKNNRTLCGKGILGWNQVIFTILGSISSVRERKNTCELDFSISNKTRLLSSNYIPRGKPLLQLTFIRP